MQTTAKPLSRDAIKYIAMFFMLCNHAANIFCPPGVFPWQVIADLGYFTAITMCFFLVEGYRRTSSPRKYGQRLLIFALLSQLPYRLALENYHNFNMLFTLLLCLLLLVGLDRCKNVPLKILLSLAVMALSVFSDWAFMAPLFTLLFAWAGTDRRRQSAAFLISILLFGGLNFVSYLEQLTAAQALLWTFSSVLGQILAAICILFLYNGQRSQRRRTFSKWFFYAFYPLHLLVLGLLRIAIA